MKLLIYVFTLCLLFKNDDSSDTRKEIPEECLVSDSKQRCFRCIFFS